MRLVPRFMSIRLKPLGEQVIVITGASSGNGLATARLAVERGAAVVIAARNGDALEAIRSELGAGGGQVEICLADVAIEADVERIATTAIAAFGRIDSWVNNAAAATYGSIEQVSIEDHRRIFDVNYFGYLIGCRVAARVLRAGGGGAIVNVGSILGDRSIVEQGPYCATKHAVQALTDVLRMELERDAAGISVTLVKPSAIDTPYPEHARNYLDTPPRLPPPLYDPALVADAVLFACATPRRVLYVGGTGVLASLAGQVAPRLTDLAMEVIGSVIQRAPGDPGRAAMRDNLYEPREDGDTNGSQKSVVRRTSVALALQKMPFGVVPLAMAGAAMLAAASVVGRRSAS